MSDSEFFDGLPKKRSPERAPRPPRVELDDDPVSEDRAELERLRAAMLDLANLWDRHAGEDSRLRADQRKFLADRSATLRSFVSASQRRRK